MGMRPKSTAVPGVVARPITDVDLAVSDETRVATRRRWTQRIRAKAISGIVSSAKHLPHQHLYLVVADSTPHL
jgi:GrpB-like predicted nucleotidyltransferase (UPF0157 family)